MTLEEFEKIREEKRKNLLAMKNEERKVDVDKEFESMQQLSVKKGNDDIFIKLVCLLCHFFQTYRSPLAVALHFVLTLGACIQGSDKDVKKRDERAKKVYLCI